MVQIGLMFEGQAGLTWTRWQRLLDAAESLGYQCVFRSDHYTIQPPDQESLEAWVSLTYAANHTKRLEFGTLVSPITFRQPALLTRMAAAVDDLSDGRLVFGLGVGWNEREHKQFGIPFYDKRTRFAMFEEGLEITSRLLREEGPVSFQGKHFSLDGAVLLPRPKRKGGPPILIGGNGPERTLPLVARYADEWNGVFLSAKDYKERNSRLSTLVEGAGRKPASVKRSLMTEIIFGDNDQALKAKLSGRENVLDMSMAERRWVVGTGSQLVDQISLYAESGLERIMLQWLNLDDLDGIEKLSKAVLPHFHKA